MGELIPFRQVITIAESNQLSFALNAALKIAKELTDVIYIVEDGIMLVMTNVYPGKNWVARVYPGGRTELRGLSK